MARQQLPRISVYCTPEEKALFRAHYKKLGYTHLAQFFRAAANEMISRHDKSLPTRVHGVIGGWE